MIEGRTIARTFWGDAWCDNLERYGDYANRLPRGRTYVRNGSVVDLQVGPGRVTALVSGSTMYDVTVTVGPVPRARWRALCKDCSGAIDSLIELLQGRFSKGVMTRLCREKTGLFPSPKDIRFTCSCPDWASCASMWRRCCTASARDWISSRSYSSPLRQVDQQDLIAKAGSDLSKQRKGSAGAKVLASDDLSEMFGIEMAPATVLKRALASAAAAKPSTAANSDVSSRQTRSTKREPTSKRRGGKPRLTPAKATSDIRADA